MKSIWWITACVLCGAIAAQAEEARVFALFAPVEQDSAEDRATVIPLPEASVNGVAVPTYGLSIADVLADDAKARLVFAPDKAETLSSQADTDVLAQLAVYYYPGGWLLVPRDWQLARAGQGVDGSQVLVFAPSSGPGFLRYVNAGACVGCAQSEAALFFPQAQQDAKDDGFDFYTGADAAITTVPLRTHVLAYEAEKEGQRIDGVVYYDKDSDMPYWRVDISLPQGERALARAVLNHFVPPREDK